MSVRKNSSERSCH